MKQFIFYFCIALSLFTKGFTSEKVVWKGQVSSDGTPSAPINLQHHKKYQIKVNGYVNLGKWIQNHQKLANDACYEFSEDGSNVEKLESFKNSSDISVCDNKYHPDHAYQSEPFIAKEDRIHFWIYDTNYSDNSGELQVQIIELE